MFQGIDMASRFYKFSFVSRIFDLAEISCKSPEPQQFSRVGNLILKHAPICSIKFIDKSIENPEVFYYPVAKCINIYRTKFHM